MQRPTSRASDDGREAPGCAVGGAGNPACPVVGSDLQIRARKLPHWQMGGAHYFVTFRAVRGELPDAARAMAMACLQFGHCRDYDLVSAVVMPDHVHCIIQPAETDKGHWLDLGHILRAIKGVSARRINRLLRTNGSVWQDESWDRIIRDEEEMIEKLAYMMHNPVKAGLVRRPENYEFLLMEGWHRQETALGRQDCLPHQRHGHGNDTAAVDRTGDTT